MHTACLAEVFAGIAGRTPGTLRKPLGGIRGARRVDALRRMLCCNEL
jgi:hypothetical protein